MRTRIILFMLCIVFLSCIWIAGAYADPPSYSMVCKGGGNMGAELRQSAKFIAITFQKSPQAAAGGQALAPGTCAWVDRPISPQEPIMLGFVFEKLPEHFIIHQQNITILFNDLSIPDQNLRYLLDAIYNGKLFYVRCYNEANHIFRITHIGP